MYQWHNQQMKSLILYLILTTYQRRPCGEAADPPRIWFMFFAKHFLFLAANFVFLQTFFITFSTKLFLIFTFQMKLLFLTSFFMKLFFYVFDKTFFCFRFGRNSLFFVFDETSFGKLHLTKLHLAKIGYTNHLSGFTRFYTGYASGIDFFFKRLDRQTNNHTNKHTLAQLYYTLLKNHFNMNMEMGPKI